MLKLTNMIFFFNNPLNFVTTNFYLHTKMSIKTTPKTAITKRLTHCRPIEINLIFNKQPSSVDMNHFIVSINRKKKPMQIFTVVFFFTKIKIRQRIFRPKGWKQRNDEAKVQPGPLSSRWNVNIFKRRIWATKNFPAKVERRFSAKWKQYGASRLFSFRIDENVRGNESKNRHL